jgi:ribose transport system substrate-binding protein
VRRLLDIVVVVAKKPICTAYDIAKELGLPMSSTYQAVNELERLSWLARDEEGFLLVGAVPQQVALSALGYDFAMQRFPPVIRYLRDQTGETVFAGSLRTDLQIGPFLLGFNSGSIGFTPFQCFHITERTVFDPASGAMNLRSFSKEPYDIVRATAEFLVVPLREGKPPNTDGILVVGISWQGDNVDLQTFLDRLVEIQELLQKG